MKQEIKYFFFRESEAQPQDPDKMRCLAQKEKLVPQHCLHI